MRPCRKKRKTTKYGTHLQHLDSPVPEEDEADAAEEEEEFKSTARSLPLLTVLHLALACLSTAMVVKVD